MKTGTKVSIYTQEQEGQTWLNQKKFMTDFKYSLKWPFLSYKTDFSI